MISECCCMLPNTRVASTAHNSKTINTMFISPKTRITGKHKILGYEGKSISKLQIQVAT